MTQNSIYGFPGERILINLNKNKDNPDLYPPFIRTVYNPFPTDVLKGVQDHIQGPRSWRMWLDSGNYWEDYDYEALWCITYKIFKNTPNENFMKNIVQEYIYSRNGDKKLKLEESIIFENLDTEIINLNQLFSVFQSSPPDLYGDFELITKYDKALFAEWLKLIPEEYFLKEIVFKYIEIQNDLSVDEFNIISLANKPFGLVRKDLKKLFSAVGSLDRW